MSQDLVFIHGMFMNPRSWAGWVEHFSTRGYRCHAPAWAGHEAEPAALRLAPPEVLRKLTLGDVIQAHRDLIEKSRSTPRPRRESSRSSGAS